MIHCWVTTFKHYLANPLPDLVDLCTINKETLKRHGKNMNKSQDYN